MDKIATYLGKSVNPNNLQDSRPYRPRARRYCCSVTLKKPKKVSMSKQEYESLLSDKDSWLSHTMEGMSVKEAVVIQSKSETKNGITLYRKVKVEEPHTEE